MSPAADDALPVAELQAAANNAAWCDAVLRSHNRETCTTPCLWSTAGEAPLYYPDAVTLGGRALVREQYAAIAKLAQAAGEAGRSIAIKDSFACLDLTPLSCAILFTANWLCLRKPASASPRAEGAARWRQIETAPELALWEQAWHGSPQIPGIFRPPLLTHADVTILAGYRHDEIVAGCTLFRSKNAVGYTNLFVPREEAESWRIACIAEIARRHPACLIFGYESGPDSAAMEDIGFRKIGNLRVWRSADR